MTERVRELASFLRAVGYVVAMKKANDHIEVVASHEQAETLAVRRDDADWEAALIEVFRLASLEELLKIPRPVREDPRTQLLKQVKDVTLAMGIKQSAALDAALRAAALRYPNGSFMELFSTTNRLLKEGVSLFDQPQDPAPERRQGENH